MALTTRPTLGDWLFSAAALTFLTVAALPLGLASGALTLHFPESWSRLATFAAVALFVPCLAEEIVFRVMMLPHTSETSARIVPAKWSVFAFVAWHPLNAALFLPGAWPLFSDVRFLVLAALLGTCCSVVYLRSGSVWPGVMVHWLVVVAWKAGFGGPLVLFGAKP